MQSDYFHVSDIYMWNTDLYCMDVFQMSGVASQYTSVLEAAGQAYKQYLNKSKYSKMNNIIWRASCLTLDSYKELDIKCRLKVCSYKELDIKCRLKVSIVD
jgi:hypothetical protein